MLINILSRRWARFVLIGVLILAGLGGYRAWKIWTDVRALENHLVALNVLATEPLSQKNLAERVQRAGGKMQSVDRAAYDLEADLGFLLNIFPYLESIPRVGGDIAAVPVLLNLVHCGASLEQHLQDTALPVLDALESNQSASAARLARVARALQLQQTEIPILLTQLDELAVARQQIHSANLLLRTVHYLEIFDTQLPRLRDALVLAQWLPNALGMNGARRYLLVFQNRDEIRATGGFLSSVGVVTLEQGELTGLTFADSGTVDNLAKPHPYPPTPLTKYMKAGIWIFRDANWSPDFPTAARMMQSLYEIDQEVKTDGVIALDDVAVGRLLDALGGADLPDYQTRVTSSNFLELVKQYYGQPIGVETNGESLAWYAHRKDFLGQVLQTFVRRAQTEQLDLNTWAQTLSAIARERHVQVYMNAREIQDLLARYQLDGAIPRMTGEYVQLVDSNVGFNKVSGKIERQLTARFTLQESARTRVQLTATYTNTNPARTGECVQVNNYESDYNKMQDGCDWNYARVYVTRDSQFISSSGGDAPEWQPPEGEGQATGFGSLLIVPRGETRNLNFEYLGAPLTDHNFKLFIQKQAGLQNLPIGIEIAFPNYWRIKESVPSPAAIQSGRMFFQMNLMFSQTFRVSFDVPTSP